MYHILLINIVIVLLPTSKCLPSVTSLAQTISWETGRRQETEIKNSNTTAEQKILLHSYFRLFAAERHFEPGYRAA
jgi:hypothetical protein